MGNGALQGLLSKQNKQWRIRFKFVLTKIVETQNTPFFKMTLSSNTMHGYRQPLFATIKGATKVYTRTYKNGDSSAIPFPRFDFVLNAVTQLNVRQKIEKDGKYWLRLYINGKHIGGAVNREPLTFKNLAVFLGRNCFCEDDGSLESVGRLWDFEYIEDL